MIDSDSCWLPGKQRYRGLYFHILYNLFYNETSLSPNLSIFVGAKHDRPCLCGPIGRWNKETEDPPFVQGTVTDEAKVALGLALIDYWKDSVVILTS